LRSRPLRDLAARGRPDGAALDTASATEWCGTDRAARPPGLPGPHAALSLLDALDAVGLRGDGRLLQLNSYENRVFQVFLEDGGAVVAKFYRPGRWSDAQILKSTPSRSNWPRPRCRWWPRSCCRRPPATDCSRAGPRWRMAMRSGPAASASVSPRCAGREPELEQPDTLRRLGRFIGRLHAVGARQPFVHRHRLDAAADGQAALARCWRWAS
jgi:hypothetical protein